MLSHFLLQKVFKEVTELLSDLPKTMTFHNLDHTRDVFLVATEIALHSKIRKEEMLVLQLASLFHDTGYLYEYRGHEEKSKLIAANFLLQENCDGALIDAVQRTIDATKMPQRPQNMIGQILCDADLFHLGTDAYGDHAVRLRREWEARLSDHSTDEQWAESNLRFLKEHRYFTNYARLKLDPGKAKNIKLLQTGKLQ